MEYWSVGRISSSITPHSTLHWAKLRQRHLRRDIFEDHPHGHPDPHFLPRALDHVADHRYLIVGAVEGDVRYDVRHVVLESGNRHVMHDHERIHGAGFAELGPVRISRNSNADRKLGAASEIFRNRRQRCAESSCALHRSQNGCESRSAIGSGLV